MAIAVLRRRQIRCSWPSDVLRIRALRALAVFLVGMAGGRGVGWRGRCPSRSRCCAATPASRPAPGGRDGLGTRCCFRSLLRGDRRLWLAGLADARWSLALILAGHVVGIATLARPVLLAGGLAGTSSALSPNAAAWPWELAVRACLVAARPAARGRSRSCGGSRALPTTLPLALLLAVAGTGIALRLPGHGADLAACARTTWPACLPFGRSNLPPSPLFVVHFTWSTCC